MARKIKKKSRGSTKTVKNPRIEYLEHLIMVSETQIDGKSESLDDLFRNQADRLRKELEEVKNETL